MFERGDLVSVNWNGGTAIGRVTRVEFMEPSGQPADGSAANIAREPEALLDVELEDVTVHGLLSGEVSTVDSTAVAALLPLLQTDPEYLGWVAQASSSQTPQAKRLEARRNIVLRQRYAAALSEGLAHARGESAGSSRYSAKKNQGIGGPSQQGASGDSVDSANVLHAVGASPDAPQKGARVKFRLGEDCVFGVADGVWESAAGERRLEVKVLGGVCLPPLDQVAVCEPGEAEPARFATGERARYVSAGHEADPDFVGTVVRVALTPTNGWVYDLEFNDGTCLEELEGDELAGV